MPFASKQETGIAQVVSLFKEPLFSSISITQQAPPFYMLGPFSHICLQLHEEYWRHPVIFQYKFQLYRKEVGDSQ